jgi:hypothetical protein
MLSIEDHNNFTKYKLKSTLNLFSIEKKYNIDIKLITEHFIIPLIESKESFSHDSIIYLNKIIQGNISSFYYYNHLINLFVSKISSETTSELQELFAVCKK